MLDSELQPTDTKPARILIVDDDRELAELMGELVAQIGHDVRVATDGREALTLVKAFDPAVVLLDLGLPDMSGYEVVRRIRALRPEGLLVAAVTGVARQGQLATARAAGFDHFLAKPVDMASLQALVGDASLPGTTSVGAAHAPARPALSALQRAVAAADRASTGGDPAALGTAVLDMIQIAPDELAIDLVAVVELSRYDFELAQLRWANLRRLLVHPRVP
jgi:CheY-like chemotaxis protein